MPTPTAVEIILTDEERAALQTWTARRKTGQALAMRARIVLAAAGQLTNREIAELEGVSAPTVTKWRNRFAERRLQGLLDEPRPGRPRTITDDQVEAVITRTLEGPPKDATHWSTRSMAREAGVTQNAVLRIWHAFGLQPHRQERFKLSKDPQFIEKVHDICGLYLNPPERAVVLAVDEKSQIQALDRTQPTLPMLPGTPERATHDYERNGTTSLYAALNIQSGEVLGSLHHKHRAVEFLQFLKRIDATVPEHLGVHLVLDNRLQSQDPEDPTLARCAPPLRAALHPDLQQLDQPRRALVRRTDHQTAASRPAPNGPPTQRRDPRLDRHLEPRPPPLRVDQNRRSNPRQHQTLPRTTTQNELIHQDTRQRHAAAARVHVRPQAPRCQERPARGPGALAPAGRPRHG
jgi:transposase